jgi:hypothetical protein
MSTLNDPRFFPLRDMETSTDEMFNRIVAFQERNHLAWDDKAPFGDRIKDLPLHYLVFSNPDRDPTQYAHTVAPYYPLREELRTIAYCARQVTQDPVILDVHGGNGFVGSLLAREGVAVVGLRDSSAKPNQIQNFFDPDFYQMREQTLAQVDVPFDVAFSSWMPAGVNVTPELIKRRPKLIVFVYCENRDQNGQPINGTDAAFEELPDNYQIVAEWSITRPENVFHNVWPDLTPSPEMTRKTVIYADTPYHDIDVKGAQPATAYDWEKELNLALLAIEGMQILKEQGIRV